MPHPLFEQDIMKCTYFYYSRENWVQYFPKRDLKAYSAEPLLIYPTHYIGDEKWFSDTG